MRRASPRVALRRGLWVFIALVVLAVVEYLLTLVMKSGNLPWMVIMNIIDAGLIAYFFMHIAQLWRREE
ncbi:MAG: hypothetical protein HYY00_08925 [Chloroflexi bacterium]|nr:hypothetical protein [Chloroflexota bacterium]